MVHLRKGCAYRRLERAYTRVSKFRELSYIRANPAKKVVRYDMGDISKSYEYQIDLLSDRDVQIRDNALESARQTANRLLEKNIGQGQYYFKIRVYPHHILRENPLASGAGADRLSTGMKMSFGKPIGSAAQVREKQKILTVKVNKAHIEAAKKALHRASSKLPISHRIEIAKIK
ncbi:50S ribosomal protein L16 [Candidatus Woesearchaeota archaeon]|nr:50S ribosomal protein L16 [Candidatus Woesearchaeota archaeon]